MAMQEDLPTSIPECNFSI